LKVKVTGAKRVENAYFRNVKLWSVTTWITNAQQTSDHVWKTDEWTSEWV